MIEIDEHGSRMKLCPVNIELLESLLTRLRVFDMKKERTNFHKIAKMIKRQYQNDGRVHEFLDESKDLFSCKREFDGVRLVAGGEPQTSEDIFGDIFYGKIFHVDKTRRERLEVWKGFPELLQFLLLHATVNKVDAVSYLRGVHTTREAGINSS